MNDVHYDKPSARFMLTRVGVSGIKKPIRVTRPGKETQLTATIDLYVDLPATHKGSHMSRNAEVLEDAITDASSGPTGGLEIYAAGLARALLQRHEYATFSEVHISADYFLDKAAPSGRKTTEVYGLEASAFGTREPGRTRVRKSIGVKVVGMTSCPCAMEGVRELMSADKPECALALRSIPVITHNQRNVTSLKMDVPDGSDVEADVLIEIVENALSSPTREILKRRDEAELVYAAHQNPKFVEDVVRGVLEQVVARFAALPGEVEVAVRSVSEESIHKHDAMAERVTTLAELRS
ncbi:MAG: GTP cyclohydrolase MptA [Methanobacteriota archaeon]